MASAAFEQLKSNGKQVKITREHTGTISIGSVSDGQLRIAGETYRKTVALTTSKIVADWDDKPVAELTPEDLAPLLDGGPEIIVLGTGSRNLFAPREITFALARRGVGLEVMDTRAAARTFNVLSTEGRKVAALLYL